MNPTRDPQPAVDPLALDLLVDGELCESERRELLTRLDRVPGAWRSCALAFLEAQCWKAELRAVAKDPAQSLTEPPAGAESHSASQRIRAPARRPFLQRALRAGGTLVAMAASFLLALVFGTQFQGLWHSPSPRDAAFEQLAGVPSGVNEAGILSQPAGPQRGPGWQIVTLRPQGGQGSIQLPAVEADRLDPSFLRPGNPLPEDVQQALERLGYQVRQHRQLVPVPMQDGRRLVVPVDQVEVHYVGNSAYQ